MSTSANYTSLSDEELLKEIYMAKPLLTALELELATRLEHALDQLAPSSAKTLEQVLDEHA